jgi:hypothetical protein
MEDSTEWDCGSIGFLKNSLAYVKQYVGGLEGTGMEGRVSIGISFLNLYLTSSGLV